MQNAELRNKRKVRVILSAARNKRKVCVILSAAKNLKRQLYKKYRTKIIGERACKENFIRIPVAMVGEALASVLDSSLRSE
ncbi:MAG: hypothetical protein LBT20_01755 [Clostridiales bacterium]|jgi:hypothetical protein|nr:hypothetical protein [Clostridiales bacterium]